MYRSINRIVAGVLAGTAALSAAAGGADSERGSDVNGDLRQSCSALPSHHQLQTALSGARAQGNGGFNLDMWGTVVNRDGVVCAVAFTGNDRGQQWPGSRNISAQKANTANAFSLPGLALSTADLYAAVQPGGTLFGLQASNPVDTDTAYRGPAANFGQDDDPMIGRRAYRRGQRLRRRACAVQREGTVGGRDRRERRHVVRRSQHCVAHASHVEP